MIATLICTGVLLALVTAYVLTGRGLQTSGSDTKFSLWVTLWFIVQGGAAAVAWQVDPATVTSRFFLGGIVIWFVIHLVATLATGFERHSGG